MRIQNNLMAVNTHRQYGINNNAVSKSAEKLASGYRINRAGDDAAGLAISEKMRAQVRGLNMASKNSQDAISLVQTAEGALQEIHSILQRMNELAVQSSSGTNDDTVDRKALNSEFVQLRTEIDDIASQTEFNDMKLLNAGTGVSTFTIQVGAKNGDTLNINISGMSATGLLIDANTVDTAAAAQTSITKIRTAVNKVSDQRADLGALQNRLEHKIANLDISAENTQAAESRIRDVDIAKEMTAFTKNNILSQAATAMLAQANAAPQNVLSLLR